MCVNEPGGTSRRLLDSCLSGSGFAALPGVDLFERQLVRVLADRAQKQNGVPPQRAIFLGRRRPRNVIDDITRRALRSHFLDRPAARSSIRLSISSGVTRCSGGASSDSWRGGLRRNENDRCQHQRNSGTPKNWPEDLRIARLLFSLWPGRGRGSIAARITLMLSARPIKAASPIRKCPMLSSDDLRHRSDGLRARVVEAVAWLDLETEARGEASRHPAMRFHSTAANKPLSPLRGAAPRAGVGSR